MRKNSFVESAILYPKTVKFENLKKIAKAQFSLALPHMQVILITRHGLRTSPVVSNIISVQQLQVTWRV